MHHKSIQQHHLIKKITRKDTLFKGDYTLDPYQNCEFGCTYCDSSYDDTIYVNINAADLLKKEVKHLKKKRVILGSVHDPYQPIEKNYEITRSLLHLLQQHDIPTHILTKSDLILRDLDILTTMKQVWITFSIPSLDHNIWHTFEGITPSPINRLQIMKTIAKKNITTGIAIIPILPFINDKYHLLDSLIKNATQHQASYVLHGYLELKGNQKTILFSLLKNYNSTFLPAYQQFYNKSIRPPTTYINKIDQTYNKICEKYDIASIIQ